MSAIAALTVIGSTYHPARAGQYIVSYSGGVAATTNPTTSEPYALGSDGFYGRNGSTGWGRGYAGGQPVFTSGSATCSGTVTTTFNWQSDGPDDPPPTDVVIAETENLQSVYSGPIPASTSNCTNDLGFAFVPYYYNSGGYANGTRYKLKSNPGLTFTITASPYATLSGPGSGGGMGGAGGSASAFYQATASPLEILLTGGIGPRDDKSFLIGQQVTGEVSTGGLVANYFDWDVSGGEPFTHWDFFGAQEYSTTYAVFLPLLPEDEKQSSVIFHFKRPTLDGAPTTVSTSFHLDVPQGALPANGLSAFLTRKCKIDYPDKTLEVYIGTVQGISSPYTPDAAHPQGMQLLSPADANGINAGIYWRGTVTTPPQYGSGGGWNITQIAAADRVRCQNGVNQKLPKNGIQGLDGRFGYNPIYPDLYPDDGLVYGSNDNPSQGWDSGTSAVAVNDSLIDYMMYVPPGTGSCFTPLRNFDWFWAGHAHLNASGIWELSNTGSAWSFGDEYPVHPEWSFKASDYLYWENQ